ncbi:L-pipecolate oxidase [Cyphellophora attinorum]|uniref:L-pipecolate oxidase n=1 Tax=Cyphellophora attinorum TaxID=1664694 RepID=A0A0N1H2L4_9EURO|nr:L-pipecolate oxidase [Phialophora attinorum]KPI34634.1 L-pipecolate oxidase [Phialophora attinorum]
MALTTSFLIVGGGTFGTAAAYELTRRGYTSVTVLDRSAPPSCEAAGNDLNKAVRADYADPLYVKMATEAIDAWRDPNGLYAGLYSRTGWILASDQDASEWIRQCSATAAGLGVENAQDISSEQIKARWPVLRGPMADWSTFWNGSAGWTNAREALNRVAKAAMNRGVKYISGSAGQVDCLLYDERGRCIGARCRNGNAHYADHVVLAAGAYSAALLDLKGQLVAKGHSVGHIKLTKNEAKKYADMPLVAHMTGGLLFPPQEDDIIKCSAMQFVTNYAGTRRGLSLPRYRTDYPGDGLPAHIEKAMRSFIGQVLPELEHREWFETRICWDADMNDYNFLFSHHPQHAGLSLAVGGSAHGFKFFPIIGKYIVDMLESKLDPATRQQWRWRPDAKRPADAPEPHPAELLDLNDLPGWKRPRAML